MPRPRREADAALEAIYAQIPDIPGCLGKCWISCSVIQATPRERQRIREAGIRISDPADVPVDGDEFWCEALGPDGRCAVYDLRPLVCRLWGVTPELPCPYGCRPEGGWLPSDVAAQLMSEAEEAGGTIRHEDPRLAAEARTLGAAAAAERSLQRGLAGDMRRAVVHTELPEAVRRRPRPRARRNPG